MYEESRGKFTLRDVILQLLIVVLFVFLLVWLFPTKGYIDSKVDPLLDTIFNTNIMNMKDAAKDYYTLARLPQNTGDKVKMTLREMLNKKLLVDFKDKYGEECDLDNSYVEVTKYDDEYVMKVNLKCSKQEDYILVHMGCYDYCSTTVCEKKNTSIVDCNGKTVTPVVTPTPTPDKKYICEYAFNTNGYYTPWVIGDWTTEKKAEISGVFEVNNTKTETQTKSVQVLSGYDYRQFYDGKQPIYSYNNVVTGQTGTTTKTCNTVTTYTKDTTYSYGASTLQGTIQTNVAMTSGAGKTYDLIASYPIECDINCTDSISVRYVYNVYANATIKKYDTISSDGGITECSETTTYTPITESERVISGFEKAWQQIPVYRTDTYSKEVPYYQYKSRTWVGGTKDTKWSTCNDSNLLNSGYVLTGNRKEVQ